MARPFDALLALLCIAFASSTAAQTPGLYTDMHWRSIGPPRAGRARALAGVPTQPNVFYAGLEQTQMIAWIAVDPRDPKRVFVAALGHPYGPNPERGIFRSTDGGATWAKVLYKDEYTSANNVLIDPSDPNTVYAALWQQQQQFRAERAESGVCDGGRRSACGGDRQGRTHDGRRRSVYVHRSR